MSSTLILTKQHYDFLQDVKVINNSLKNCVNNFVKIGFKLDSIKENKSYELIGYKTFDDFTKNEFSLGSTSCKNYIAVAKKFGDPKTLELLDKYKKYSLSQLTELLSVDDDSIEKYSPALSTKQIRSLKIINQCSDYKDKFRKWIQFYFDENKEELNSYFKIRLDNSYMYAIYFYSTRDKWDSFFKVNFNDGYFYFEYDKKIYDLDFERFQELFKKEFLKAIKAEKKKIDKKIEEENKRAEEEKAAYEASLPENQPGLSVKEVFELRQDRLSKEKLVKDISKLEKNKKYNFDYNVNPASYGVPMMLRLFIFLNKIDYRGYPLIYSKDDYVGLINGLTHLRFYDERVDKYNSDTKAFETIITLDSLRLMIGQLFKGENFSNLIDLNPEKESYSKYVYSVDVEKTLDDIKECRFGFEK